jgi:hypothetical protein
MGPFMFVSFVRPRLLVLLAIVASLAAAATAEAQPARR